MRERVKKVLAKENNRRVCMKSVDSVVTCGRDQIKRIVTSQKRGL